MSVPRFASAGLLLVACASAEPARVPEPTAPVPATASAPAAFRASDLDAQARELAAIPDAQVERRDDVLFVRFASASLFDPDSAELSPGGQERVASLARSIAADPKRVIVRGHTDGQRDDRASQVMSEELADSVRNCLVAEGVVPSRVTAVGLAASQPLATNSTAEGREQNRRVEIELWPEQ
jgi:outer membrane protein OmpA-like peptidoglycan-associated protein